MTRVVILLTFCTALSCVNGPASKEKLMNYLFDTENNLTLGHEWDGVSTTCTYWPKDLILQQQLSGHNYSETQIDSIRMNLSAYEYFHFKISVDGKDPLIGASRDSQQFQRMSEYLSYYISEDVQLMQDDKAIPVEDFVYARGDDSNATIIFAFRTQLNGDAEVAFNDRYFHSGLNNYHFSIHDIKSIPTLTL